MSDRDDDGFVHGAGKISRVIGTSRVIKDFVPGQFYTFSCVGATAVCLWRHPPSDTSASPANGEFDFVVSDGERLFTRCPVGSTELSVIESDQTALPTARLYVSSVNP